MGRAPRLAVGNLIYHVINRANGKEKIFHKEFDYKAFIQILVEAKEKIPMRILAFCIMPNHWHFILQPYNDNDLSKFIQRVTLTHTQRWHAHYESVGFGHLYQGRFKSFPIQEDEHFITVARYVERNALRAKLTTKAEDWRCGSSWLREYGTNEQLQLLSPWPMPKPDNYLEFLNATLSHEEMLLDDIRFSLQRGKPFGDEIWTTQTVKKLGLESTMRSTGRPKKGV